MIPHAHEVLHALGHHPWVYLCWCTRIHIGKSGWIHSHEETDPGPSENELWPVRVCPICGLIEENKRDKPWFVSWSYYHPELRYARDWCNEVTEVAKMYYEEDVCRPKSNVK